MGKYYSAQCVACGRTHSMPFRQRESDFYCNVECMRKAMEKETEIAEPRRRKLK